MSKARSVMHGGAELPVVPVTARLAEAIVEMTSKRFGIPGVVDAAGELVGGIFYFNYPGGTGLTAGSVFGRIAGAAAGKAARG